MEYEPQIGDLNEQQLSEDMFWDTTTKQEPEQQFASLKFDENNPTEKPCEEEESFNLSPIIGAHRLSPILARRRASRMSIDNQIISVTPITVGFLSITNVGLNVIMKLINSGHKVNLWNKSSRKFEKVEEEADGDANQDGFLKTYKSPWNLVRNSKVIFSCFDDSCSSIEVCGVLQHNSLVGKGYVEMSSIDPETSKDIEKIIESKGGRYLEAQVQGRKEQKQEGNLIIVAAGDKSLFDDCKTCFETIAKTTYYLGPVGSVTKMKLCINMALGISLAGLAESMALVERCGLSRQTFFEIFNSSDGASNYLSSEGQVICDQKADKVQEAVENIQRDLKCCLKLSDDVNQTLPVAAAAKEMFKQHKGQGLANTMLLQ